MFHIIHLTASILTCFSKESRDLQMPLRMFLFHSHVPGGHDSESV